jgi:hypothetical protein
MPMSEQKNTYAGAEVKSVKLEAVVTRADGTVEDLGTLAEWERDDDPTTTTRPGKVRFTYGE